MSDVDKDWYCDYNSAIVAICMLGRATRKIWKTSFPGQYIYWRNHGLSPSELMVHTTTGDPYFQPSSEDINAKDWIVYYDRNIR